MTRNKVAGSQKEGWPEVPNVPHDSSDKFVLHCIVSHCISLQRVALYSNALHCIDLLFFALDRFAIIFQ